MIKFTKTNFDIFSLVNKLQKYHFLVTEIKIWQRKI